VIALNKKMAKSVLVTVISGGGFTFETKCLLQALEGNFKIIYLKTSYGGVPGEGGIPLGEAHPVPSFATVTQPSNWQSLKAFSQCFYTTLSIMRKNKVRIVLVVGCSYAVPMFLAGRLFGCKTVYVESITRVNQLSNTGKLVYYLRLASTFLVQWPSLQRQHASSLLGSIL
jgi:beta-1,4-N-acetylglucosaminyltransferase